VRLASVLLAALIFGVSFVATSVVPVCAVEFGTRDEAVAMVRRVQEKFKKDGAEATFKAIDNKAFLDRDLSPWEYRLSDGANMANAFFPAVRGKRLIDLKGLDGKFITQEWIKIATTPPYHGWSNYRWPSPVANTVDDQSSWIERLGSDYLVGVGINRFQQPNENTVGLISGSPNSDDTYLQIAYDLDEVLNDDNLRILPIVGVGGPRNICDVRYVKGIDIGLTQTSILNNFRRSQ
jgi:cytochrome c